MNAKTFLLLAVSLSLAPRYALAGDAAAEALFRAGREAAEKGDHQTACARFEESHRLEPASGTVVNLAVCYEKLGQVASAWQRFREARERLPSNDERAVMATERIAALEPRLPKLTLRLATRVVGATVLRDGVELGAGSLGFAVPVDPGRHEIVLRANGRTDRRVTVELAEGEHKEVVLDPGEVQAAAVSTQAQPSSSTIAGEAKAHAGGSSQRTVGFVVGGVGVAGLAASLVTGAFVLDKKATVDDECRGDICSKKGVDAADTGHSLSTVSTVAFAVGAAGVGVGAVLILTASDESERATALRFKAYPGAATLELGGSF